jgi:hypothetical protein
VVARVPNDGFTGYGIMDRRSFASLGSPNRDEVRLAYDVILPADFNPYAGGKLPGVAGRSGGLTQFTSGGFYDERGFTARLMWLDDLRITSYLYVKSVGGKGLPVNAANGRTYGFSQDARGPGGDLRLNRGASNRIEMRVRMNTPGVADGVFQVWVNGVLGINLGNVVYRTGSHPDLRISDLMFESYFGGPTSNRTEQRWAFDRVSLAG